uniref:Uncharacterized protein n=1 Tax=Cacopsylla melanoneura TaxID=428564 RepID=A0A8D8RE39_9HEMI
MSDRHQKVIIKSGFKLIACLDGFANLHCLSLTDSRESREHKKVCFHALRHLLIEKLVSDILFVCHILSCTLYACSGTSSARPAWSSRLRCERRFPSILYVTSRACTCSTLRSIYYTDAHF